MKKFLYLIFFTLISFIPILKVSASTSTNFEVKEDENFNKVFEWLYNTSNDYLLSIGNEDNYRTIYMTSFYYSSSDPVKEYTITVVTSNVENNIVNTYQNGYTRGLILINPFPKTYVFEIKTSDFINYYNTNNVAISNIENAYFGGSSNVTSDRYIYEVTTSNFTPINFRVYFSNMKLRNSTNSSVTNRTLTLYNTQNELVGTYGPGDLLPSYISLYHSKPDYLNGYKQVTLTTNDRYLMISDISSGSVYIPYGDFISSGGRLSYYDKDLSSQLYTSYITDYQVTSDGLYARQDFNIDNYTGADWVMFSKYLYLEGEDDITYSIWVPDTSYDSNVTITPNNQGGNDFDFTYKDENGTIQDGSYNSIDLDITTANPLLGKIFQDFSSNTFGLTSIITAPLSLISNLLSSTCSSLSIPLPYVNSNLVLPCMSSIYQNYFGDFFGMYQEITFGIIAYWVIVKIFNLVKDFKNPDHDEIEVLDL